MRRNLTLEEMQARSGRLCRENGRLMAYEKSCGAAIWRMEEGKRLYLLTYKRREQNGVLIDWYDLPKGHMEEGETEAETAEREILEETGLRVEIDTGFRCRMEWMLGIGVPKVIMMFAAHCPDPEPVAQRDAEAEGMVWMPYEQAYPILCRDGYRRVLKNAERYLNGKRA